MHLVFLLLPGVLCQFEMRPDVRFDERNDRFDVSPLFDAGEYAEKEDYRRSGGKSHDNDPILVQLVDLSENIENPKQSDEKMVIQLLNVLQKIKRRTGYRQDSFAYHDDMRSAEEEQNFERNLEQFRPHDFRKSLVDYLHGGQPDEMPPTRRSGVDSDKEVLMHHALPISMKVKGYLQAPRIL